MDEEMTDTESFDFVVKNISNSLDSYMPFNKGEYHNIDAEKNNEVCARVIIEQLKILNEDEMLNMLTRVQHENNIIANEQAFFQSILKENFTDFYNKYKILMEG